MSTPTSSVPPPSQTGSVSANQTVHGSIDFSGVGFAPLFFGFSLSTALYGILVIQTYVYFLTYKRDKLWLRLLVLYLFLMETAMTIYNGVVVCGITTDLSVVGRFKDSGVDPSEKMMSNNTIFTVLLSTPVQLFLAWRIRIMDAPKITSILIILLSFTSFGGGIATSILVPRSDQVMDMSNASTVPRSASSPPFVWLGASALADLFITGTLVYTLHAKRTGIKATDDILQNIIKITIETGMLTFVCTIVEAALFASSVPEPLYLIPDMMISKLYANSMIATLNARSRHTRPTSQGLTTQSRRGGGTTRRMKNFVGPLVFRHSRVDDEGEYGRECEREHEHGRGDSTSTVVTSYSSETQTSAVGHPGRV